MQSTIAQKREQFQVEIRRQSHIKLFNLRRIKPKLIQSDNDAVCFLSII